ncbi:MAG: hypothetical protein ACOCQR_01590 [bacterium]
MKRVFNEKGISLIETVISLIIIAIIITTFLHITTLSLRTEKRSKLQVEAINLAQSSIEYLKNPNLDYEGISFGEKEKVSENFEREIVIYDYDNIPHLKEIKITIFWNEKGIANEYTVSALVYKGG